MQTTLKKIGNSLGVILNQKLLTEAGISNTSNITVEAKDNTIIITPVTDRAPINRDLSTWRKQMKAAIKEYGQPEKSLWGNRLSEDEENEWTW